MAQGSILSFFQRNPRSNVVAQATTMKESRRSESVQSSRLGLDASSNASSAQSMTPPTSVTDSINSDAIDQTDKATRSSHRLRHSTSNVTSYNENVLRGAIKRSRRKTTDVISRNVSGETLVPEDSEEHEKFVEETVRPLSRDFDIGPLPGDDLKLVDTPKVKVERRKSTRLDVLDKASTILERTNSTVEKAKTVLGKRSRDTVEAGIGRIKSLKAPKQAKAPKDDDGAGQLTFEGPVAKRARLDDEVSPGRETKSVARTSNRKKYLAQGLYVGQERGFNPKWTETKNRLKNAIYRKDDHKRKPLLPLPMFAGQRTLDNGRLFKLPFDVFSPLPPGQHKPDEWKKTNKNVFIGDAAEIWRKPEKLAQSRCLCTSSTGCNEDCHNRLMLYECDSSNCRLTPSQCGNRAFADLQARREAGGKYRIGVEVCKTGDRGYGVRANRMFEPNQIIVEYTGEIITQEECEARMRTQYKDAECYYLMDFDQGMILDATRGSIARFINHSCEPNCRMIKWTVQGKPRMALFAGDDGIMTGEELTYDYNFDPYSTKNVQECRCGTASCRGVLGPKPKELKDALRPIVGAKRKFGDVVNDSMEAVKTQTKKRKVAVASGVRSAIASAKATAEDTLSSAQEGATTTLKSARASASDKLARARSLASSSINNISAKSSQESLVNKGSRPSLRSNANSRATVESSTSEEATKDNRLRRRHTIVTYTHTNPVKSSTDDSRRKSDYTRLASNPSQNVSPPEPLLVDEEDNNTTNPTPSDNVSKDEDRDRKSTDYQQQQRPLSRSQSLKNKVGSVRKNVVRSVAGRHGTRAEGRNGNGKGKGKTIRVIDG